MSYVPNISCKWTYSLTNYIRLVKLSYNVWSLSPFKTTQWLLWLQRAKYLISDVMQTIVKTYGRSWFSFQADIVGELVFHKKLDVESVIVVTQYHAQCGHVKQRLEQHGLDVAVTSILDCQGKKMAFYWLAFHNYSFLCYFMCVLLLLFWWLLLLKGIDKGKTYS